MRNIVFAMTAVLAMASLATAAPVLGLVQNADPISGGRSYTVQATGEGINILDQFQITGSRVAPVYQTSATSDWAGDSSAGGPTDSYVIFGDVRLPDFGGLIWDTENWGPAPDKFTVETVATAPGWGTLNNYVLQSTVVMSDSYLDTNAVMSGSQTIDLLHLVVPDGAQVDVSLRLVTGSSDPLDRSTEVHDLSTTIYSPLDGDANLDGTVDVLDLSLLGLNWQTGTTWGQGNFDGTGTTDILDLSAMGLNWDGEADWYPLPPAEGMAPPASVPEPGTIVMLVLGALCLAGYRLRK